MAPNDIVADLRLQPFEPFRIHVVDGATYDIYHPDQCIVTLVTVTVGVYPTPEAPLADRTVKLDCRLISRLEPLAAIAQIPGGIDHYD